MDDPYYISSHDYLKRARQLLDQNKTSSLFHAAFELRCGIEARMQEYLDVQDHISKKKRSGWRVVELGKNIEETFRLGDKKAILRVKDKKRKNCCMSSHTPLSHYRLGRERSGPEMCYIAPKHFILQKIHTGQNFDLNLKKLIKSWR